MGEKSLRRLFFAGALAWAAGFAVFYYKYVPLVPGFQAFLAPVLLSLFMATAVRLEWGASIFIALVPLINSLPYFFEIYDSIPHAPTALVAGIVFFGGWLFGGAIGAGRSIEFPAPLRRPLAGWALLIAISAIVTFWRYTDFVPLVSGSIREFQVNVTGVRAGGALMSDIFAALNYLTGFFVFGAFVRTSRLSGWKIRTVVLVSATTFVSLLFGAAQGIFAPDLGNTPFWTRLRQINASFTDPNAFGAYVTACLPLFLAAALHFRGRKRLFFSGLIVLSLGLLPFIGSRSSLLALAVSLGTFSILSAIEPAPSSGHKLRKVFPLAAVLALLIIGAYMLGGRGILLQRIRQDMESISDTTSLNRIANFRLQLWKAAGLMLRDYPITGVGVGAYIIELPNYFKRMGLEVQSTDSALNYILQVGSEMGALGLAMMIWLWLGLFRCLKRVWRQSGANGMAERWIFRGAMSGIAAIFTGFFFHTYIGNPEITYLFWLLVALALAGLSAPGETADLRKQRSALKAWPMLAVAIYAAIHLWNSVCSLSPAREAEASDRDRDFGLYEKETDKRGLVFRWTRESAGFSVRNLGPVFVLPVIVSHPDTREKPVRVSIYLADRHFNPERLLEEINFYRPGQVNFEYSVETSLDKRLFFVFHTSHVWNPGKILGVSDPRAIGAGLGEGWFRFPSEITSERRGPAETLPAKFWEGPQGAELNTNGMYRMRFQTAATRIAVRLRLRGTLAFGIGPLVRIRIDGRLIGDTMLEEETWRPLVFSPLETGPGYHVISVEFLNDLYAPDRRQDRNLFLGDLEVIPLK